ncbi:hypothetical protein MRX96_037922 [Rhipicephalus microplus]
MYYARHFSSSCPSESGKACQPSTRNAGWPGPRQRSSELQKWWDPSMQLPSPPGCQAQQDQQRESSPSHQ